MEWYAVRTISGKEKTIQELILNNAQQEGLSKSIKEVLVPSEEITEMRDGKKRKRNKLFFPGYLLIQMEMNNETRYFVENTNHVMSFVGVGGNPQPLKDDEIKRFLGIVESKDGKVSLSASFRHGVAVKVVDGPFKDFDGVIEEVNEDRKKIKVMVSIFGRPTPVELDYLQVEIER